MTVGNIPTVYLMSKQSLNELTIEVFTSIVKTKERSRILRIKHMSIMIYKGGSFADSNTVRKYDGSSWIDVESAKRYNGSSWVDVWPDEEVIVDPSHMDVDSLMLAWSRYNNSNEKWHWCTSKFYGVDNKGIYYTRPTTANDENNYGWFILTKNRIDISRYNTLAIEARVVNSTGAKMNGELIKGYRFNMPLVCIPEEIKFYNTIDQNETYDRKQWFLTTNREFLNNPKGYEKNNWTLLRKYYLKSYSASIYAGEGYKEVIKDITEFNYLINPNTGTLYAINGGDNALVDSPIQYEIDITPAKQHANGRPCYIGVQDLIRCTNRDTGTSYAKLVYISKFALVNR